VKGVAEVRRFPADVQRRGRLRSRVEFGRKAWRSEIEVFLHNRLAAVGCLMILGFALMGLAHPLLMATVWPGGVYHPERGYDESVLPWPSPPTRGHLMGVDAVGRDVFSMLLASTRSTFAVAVTAALTTAVLALALACLAAVGGGALDLALGNLSEALQLLPAPVLMVLLGAAFSGQIDELRFGLIYGILAGAGSAAVVLRSQALSVMTRPYIEASRVAGARPLHIVVRHLIPQLLPLAGVHMMLAVTGAVVADGFIAWMGLRDVRLNWGTMAYWGVSYLTINPQVPWIQILAPSLALSAFTAAFYLVANGLQDIADPRRQQRLAGPPRS
jgi:peptide/nickel transport system permease protein